MASGNRTPPWLPGHRSHVSGARRMKRMMQLRQKDKLVDQAERLERRLVKKETGSPAGGPAGVVVNGGREHQHEEAGRMDKDTSDYPVGAGGNGGGTATKIPVTERFTPLIPESATVELHETIAAVGVDFTKLAAKVDEALPDGREKSIALAKLEEAHVATAAAIGRNKLEGAWS